jgi:transposase
MHPRVAGIDVHRMKHVVTILIGQEDGAVSSETREFGGFKRDMRALVAWLQTHRIQQVVMESTGIYWKSVFAHLEAAGIAALVVNAFHVKNVPGRKTDVGDSEWLARLARFGLLRGSFIPPKDLRELRIVSRYRRKLTGMLAGEKNRLHKLLDDAGIKLGGVVADIDGVCASKMVEGLIAGGKPDELAALGRGKVRATTDILEAAMDGELSARPPPRSRYGLRSLALSRRKAGRIGPLSPCGDAALRLGLASAPNHSGHRRNQRRHDSDRDRRRSASVRIPGALGVLERPVSRQQRVGRQA